MSYTKELATAIAAAHKAGEIQLVKQPGIIEQKQDHSPVTDIDKECEEVIINTILAAFPEDGILGEETGASAGKNTRLWIIDPLDGTWPFIKGIPTYSVLVCLEENGIPVVGVVYFPTLQETYRGSLGHGAFCNDKQIHVSFTSRIDQAVGSCLGYYETPDSCKAQKVLDLIRRWAYHYGFMDAYSYMCVASGKLDLCVSLIDKPWDRAAAACIIREAGGFFSDFSGAATIYNSSFIVSNTLLHDPALSFVR